MGDEFSKIFSETIPPRVRPFLVLLRHAYFYAKQSNTDVWEFALELEQVKNTQISISDLRWLVRTGLVDHAMEITCSDDAARQFEMSDNLSFSDSTCFVLTEKGLHNLTRVNGHANGHGKNGHGNGHANGHANGHNGFLVNPMTTNGFHQSSVDTNSNSKPMWDSDSRELRICGRIVKLFKWKAANQERVLAAFEEEGWPECIDDPLPPSENVNPKRRLHDTIKCLNRNQLCKLVRFHGNGNGEGVIWRIAVLHDR